MKEVKDIFKENNYKTICYHKYNVRKDVIGYSKFSLSAFSLSLTLILAYYTAH